MVQSVVSSYTDEAIQGPKMFR